jgi:hypothetical protein
LDAGDEIAAEWLLVDRCEASSDLLNDDTQQDYMTMPSKLAVNFLGNNSGNIIFSSFEQ